MFSYLFFGFATVLDFKDDLSMKLDYISNAKCHIYHKPPNLFSSFDWVVIFSQFISKMRIYHLADML